MSMPNHITHNHIEKETFHISNKFISSQEWDSISLLLTKPSSQYQYITTIHLSGINIDSYGLRSLSSILNSNRNLKILKLDWNYLSEYIEDFDMLCESIVNSSINQVYLNNNKLNSTNVFAICKLLTSRGLVILDLRWNEIGNEGAREILKNLNNNRNNFNSNFNLKELNLLGNNISQEILFEINEKINLYKNSNFQEGEKKGNLILQYDFMKTNNFRENFNKSQNFRENFQNFNNSQNFQNFNQDQDHTELLLKEKQLTNEYKTRYESQLQLSTTLEKKLKELEVILTNEKSSLSTIKSSHTKELHIEREKNLQYEEIILKQKEDFMSKELEWKKLLSDTEKDISKLIQEKHEITIDNDILKEEKKLLSESYEEKLKSLQEMFEKKNFTLQSGYDSIKIENESLRRNFFEEKKILSKEFDRKLKIQQDLNLTLKSTNDELEKEILIIKREFHEYKMNKEFEIKERESRIAEEENRKIENIVKQYESRFKSFENFKNELSEKNQKLIQEIENLRKSLIDESIEYERSIQELKNEKSDILKNYNLLLSSVNKMNSDLGLKEGIINVRNT
jgi:hypothetical protein